MIEIEIRLVLASINTIYALIETLQRMEKDGIIREVTDVSVHQRRVP